MVIFIRAYKLRTVLLMLVMSVSCTLHGHEGHANVRAVTACPEKQLADSCSYILSENKLHKGTCRSMAEKLMCVRNQPIEIYLEKSQKTETLKKS
jgi:hypothetical protein